MPTKKKLAPSQLKYPQNMNLKKTRAIGIETEILVNSTQSSLTPVKSQQVPAKMKQQLKNTLFREYHGDSGAVEFTTMPVKLDSLKKPAGKKKLQEYFQILQSYTTVSDNNGTHIHMSILNDDHEELEANVLCIVKAFQGQMHKLLGRNAHWAQAPGISNKAGAKRYLGNIGSRPPLGTRTTYQRQYLLITPTRKQTLEMRGPRGSNNYHEVMAWTEFLENVINAANKESVQGLEFKSLLEGPNLKAYVKTLYGARAISRAQMNFKLNEENLSVCA